MIGCDDEQVDFITDDRKANGLVIILPGIEGESPLNQDIRRGIASAGVYRALPIYHWGRPIPIAGPLINQMDVIGNRLAGAQIARMIMDYQDAYPGRPVYLVGHSGGGGVAVFAAESLPEGRQVDGLVLLSASITSSYDLTKAMKHSKNGVVNFYSKADVGFLVVGTTLAGNVDGTHGPAAGAIGFDWPKPADSPARRQAYAKVYQIEMTEWMTGGGEAHAASTGMDFVSSYVAPWIASDAWPVGNSASYAAK
jgi:pimeloyl-ACP methyl ester carboxylesterase